MKPRTLEDLIRAKPRRQRPSVKPGTKPRRGETVRCAICNIKIYKSPSAIAASRSGEFTCSRACKAEHHRRNCTEGRYDLNRPRGPRPPKPEGATFSERSLAASNTRSKAKRLALQQELYILPQYRPVIHLDRIEACLNCNSPKCERCTKK